MNSRAGIQSPPAWTGSIAELGELSLRRQTSYLSAGIHSRRSARQTYLSAGRDSIGIPGESSDPPANPFPASYPAQSSTYSFPASPGKSPGVFIPAYKTLCTRYRESAFHVNSHAEIYLHYIWATYNRLPLITPEIEPAIYACIAACCRELKVQMLAVGGVMDHVHVLVRVRATTDIPKVAQRMKGASSHLASKKLGVAEFKWQGGYFVRSLAPNGVTKTCDYIAAQKEHHAQKTANHLWELDQLDKHSHDEDNWI